MGCKRRAVFLLAGLYEATYHWETTFPKANCSYPAGHGHAYTVSNPELMVATPAAAGCRSAIVYI
jgi:hypothetical protein